MAFANKQLWKNSLNLLVVLSPLFFFISFLILLWYKTIAQNNTNQMYGFLDYSKASTSNTMKQNFSSHPRSLQCAPTQSQALHSPYITSILTYSSVYSTVFQSSSLICAGSCDERGNWRVPNDGWSFVSCGVALWLIQVLASMMNPEQAPSVFLNKMWWV